MAGCKKSRGLNNPKMKSKSSAKKRFSLTGTGKIQFKKKGLRHNLSNKNRKRKRNLSKAGIMNTRDVQVVIRSILV